MTAPRFQGVRHTARSLALQVLLDVGEREGFIQEVLDRHLGTEAGRSVLPPDRRLATHLAYGVLRRRGTLQALLAPLVSRPAEKVEAWLWEALRIGAYQLALLTQIPPHAALNETVELAAGRGPRASSTASCGRAPRSSPTTPPTRRPPTRCRWRGVGSAGWRVGCSRIRRRGRSNTWRAASACRRGWRGGGSRGSAATRPSASASGSLGRPR